MEDPLLPFGTPELLRPSLPGGEGRPVAPPLGRATSFEFPDRASMLGALEGRTAGRLYPRHSHEAGLLFEARMAELEGGEGGLAFSSGMAAVTALFLGLLEGGDPLGLARRCYGGTLDLARFDLPRLGIEVLSFDPLVEAEVAAACDARPRLVHVESPVNPTMRVLDLPALSRRVHEAGSLLSVDATLLPPPFQQSLRLGADLSVHSATKYLGGHTDVLAGVISGSVPLLTRLEGWRRRSGAILAPDAAWLLCRSLETLELRFGAQCETACLLAGRLQERREELRISRVHHPGLPRHPDRKVAARDLRRPGAMFAVEVQGGLEEAVRAFDALRVFRKAPSLGGVESLVSLPADSSHANLSEEEMRAAGFGPSTLRFSVGLEDADLLLADLEQAFG